MGTTAAATAEADVSINKKDLVTALAEQHRLNKRASQKMLDDLIVMITRHLKKGERVKITGLGILQVRKRAAPGPQSSHRRGNQDQGQQTRGLPRYQETQDSGVIANSNFCFRDTMIVVMPRDGARHLLLLRSRLQSWFAHLLLWRRQLLWLMNVRSMRRRTSCICVRRSGLASRMGLSTSLSRPLVGPVPLSLAVKRLIRLVVVRG